MKLTLLATLALLGMSSAAFSQADDKGKDKTTQGKTMTGCLSTAPGGTTYTFTEEGTGKQITVAGHPDLSKHAANHTVKITTASGTPASDSSAVTVSKIEHVSDSCTAKK